MLDGFFSDVDRWPVRNDVSVATMTVGGTMTSEIRFSDSFAKLQAIQVSQPHAAFIRSGRLRPHPRHWPKLAQLVGSGFAMGIFQLLSEFVVGGCGERAFKINRLADNAVAMSGWAAK